MKTKNSPVLLRSVKKSRLHRSSAKSTPCANRKRPTTCAHPVSNSAAFGYPPTLPELFAGCAPEVMAAAKVHLDHATGTDRALLDGWRKVGREDAHRPARPNWTHTAERTMTPLGIACLLEYARAFDDERTAMLADTPA